jgi:histone deacetylase 1/2
MDTAGTSIHDHPTPRSSIFEYWIPNNGPQGLGETIQPLCQPTGHAIQPGKRPAAYLYNRTPHSALDYVTPYEKMFNKIPDLSYIRIFGSKVNVKDELVPKGEKFSKRSTLCYLVGFTKTGYKVYDAVTRKMFPACNVVVDETKLYKNAYPSTTNDTFRIIDESPNNDSVSEMEVEIDYDWDISEPDEMEVEIDYDWDSTKLTAVPLEVNFCSIDPTNVIPVGNYPLTFEEAMSGSNKQKWQPAVDSELQSMAQHNVWSIVPKDVSKKIVPVKWVFTLKSDGTPKARLVAVGCRDKEVYLSTDTNSPTPSPATIRWFFATVIHCSWKATHLDVTTAFLHSEIDREKYISLPPGVEGDPKKVMCKLHKALYGLATAPKCWNDTLNRYLLSQQFERNLREPSIYTKKTGDLLIMVLVYVDDLCVTGSDVQGIATFLQSIKLKFQIKDLDKPKKFVGLQIDWRDNDQTVLLHQSEYITTLLQTFGMSECTEAKNTYGTFLYICT